MIAQTLSLEEKTVDFTCETHGVVKARVFKVTGDFSPASCHYCKADQRRAAEAEEASRAAQREAQATKAALEARIKGACIPVRFQDRKLGTYQPTTPAAHAVLAKCKDYAENFEQYARRGACMILCGHAGTGKTHLACAIANHLIHQKGKSAVYMQVSDAIGMVKETFSRDKTRSEKEIINWFKKMDLLVLDEVGVQFGTETERFILFQILNARYEEMKPTLLLSNLDMAGLMQYAGERVIDRMKENGGQLLTFEWASHRGMENLPTP